QPALHCEKTRNRGIEAAGEQGYDTVGGTDRKAADAVLAGFDQKQLFVANLERNGYIRRVELYARSGGFAQQTRAEKALDIHRAKGMTAGATAAHRKTFAGERRGMLCLYQLEQ